VQRGSYTSVMPPHGPRPAVGLRPRGFVSVRGPGAEDYLQRMVSNDVAALGAGEACEALLLTPKARVIAPLTVVRRTEQDFLLLTEPELAEVVRSHLLAFRFAARLDVELEEHESFLLLGGPPPVGAALSVGTTDYGEPVSEVLDEAAPAELPRVSEEELDRLRIEAGTPRFGREIDDRVLPAEAGLVERAVSLTKGCYPGQEPIARLHYRGHANRGLRVLRVETDSPLPPDAEVRLGDKVVGRVTSSARANGALVALAYVRTEVPREAELAVGDSAALPLDG
jgi:tRNA-modifying protein YgfZ